MKIIRAYFWLVLCLIYLALPWSLSGAPMRCKTITWNPNPPADDVVRYEIWNNGKLLVTTEENSVRQELPYRLCVIQIKAINRDGIASEFSVPVIVPSAFDEHNPRIQFSPDMHPKAWDSQFTPQKRFARIEYTLP